MQQIYDTEVFDKVYALSSDMSFSIDFTKANGEQRHYSSCRMHVKPAYEKQTERKGISTQEAKKNKNLLKFWCDDVNGYRSCSISSISRIQIGESAEPCEVIKKEVEA